MPDTLANPRRFRILKPLDILQELQQNEINSLLVTQRTEAFQIKVLPRVKPTIIVFSCLFILPIFLDFLKFCLLFRETGGLEFLQDLRTDLCLNLIMVVAADGLDEA